MTRICLLCEATSEGTAVTFRRRDICTACEASLARIGRAWCAYGKHAVALVDMNKERCTACDAARNKARSTPRARAEESRAYRATRKAQLRAYYARPEVRERRRLWQRMDYARNPAHYRAVYRRHAAYKRDYSRQRYWSNLAYWRAQGRQRRIERKLAILRTWRPT